VAQSPTILPSTLKVICSRFSCVEILTTTCAFLTPHLMATR
jgi:hypothetical protein